MARGRPIGVKDTRPRVRLTQPSTSRARVVRKLFEKLNVNKLMTLSELADRSGYSRQCISFYKSGRNMPSAEAIELIGETVGYELVWVRKGASASQLMADLGLSMDVNVTKKESKNETA